MNSEVDPDTPPVAAPASDTKKPSPWRLLPLVVIAVAGVTSYFAFDLGQYFSFEALGEHRQALLTWRDDNQALAMVTLVLAYGVVVALSLPGAVWMTLAGGFMFGLFEGTGCAVVGATLGATGVFLVARYALADFFQAKAGPMVRKMEAGFRDNALSYLLFLRLVPLFPFWLVNLVPAILGIPLRTYVIATLVGIIPGTFVFNSVGNGLGKLFDSGQSPDLGIIFAPEILLPIIGLSVLSLVPIAYKKFRGSEA
jgi:uncharacterized membrane protein YdjX (TVP38/TMEM64 family)